MCERRDANWTNGGVNVTCVGLTRIVSPLTDNFCLSFSAFFITTHKNNTRWIHRKALHLIPMPKVQRQRL